MSLVKFTSISVDDGEVKEGLSSIETIETWIVYYVPFR
jgi:hypothetical protein